jgi:pilus assembly protein CpaF
MPAESKAIYTITVAHYLAPIKPYLEDTAVSEVMVNQFNEIYIERDGKLEKTDARFADTEAYESAVNNILQFTGKSINDENPLIDSRLPDGSRVHVAKWPCARHGTVTTIRKFNRMMLDMDWLIELGTLNDQAAEYLKIAVRAERNMLVAGGTSSGKTSLLNALSKYIPNQERVVVIEDSAELDLQKDHVVSLESRPADRYGRGAVGIRELFRSSLRLRPDRIIIGEVRGGEALDMIQAMTSGHGGSMGTLHADSAFDALSRLETLALMSKVELPLYALRAQIASALDLVVQMSRHVGGRRLVNQITEIEPLGDDGHYRLRDVFTSQVRPHEKTMQLTWTGKRSTMAGHLRPEEQAQVTDLTRAIFEVPKS